MRGEQLAIDVTGGEQADTVPAPAGVAVGTFAGFDTEGRFRVLLTGQDDPMNALSTIGLMADDHGLPVVVAYEQGDRGRLIIIGRVHERRSDPAGARTEAAAAIASRATIDRDRILIRADRDLELRCGDASIVLTRAGKVLIKGNFVLTKSRGANKIKGAYVDIN